MKKLLLSFILLSSTLLVNTAFATPCPPEYDACSDAVRPEAGGGSAIGMGGSSGNQTGAAGQVKGEEEGLKKAEAAKDAFCANNPTNSFCIERAKTKCINQANETGKQCNDAYSTLNKSCKALSGGLGLVGGMAGKAFLAKIEVELSPQMVGMIKGGAGTTGLLTDEILPCSDWNSQALKFCSAGVEKMKASCSK